jgi:hypothetical protein
MNFCPPIAVAREGRIEPAKSTSTVVSSGMDEIFRAHTQIDQFKETSEI